MQSPVDGAPDRSMVTTANVAPSGTGGGPPRRAGSLATRRTEPSRQVWPNADALAPRETTCRGTTLRR
jgi:hypothetical protein